MNDTANEVFYLTEDEKAKVTWYHLATYKIQEEQHGMASCINDAASEATYRGRTRLLPLKVN
jgi:hypothetical protein